MPDALSQISTRSTPQTEPARPDQVPNSAGGYVFATSDDVALHRFLTLGTEGGTYYATEQKLTREVAGHVLDMARRDAAHVARAAAEVSQAGRAPRNNPALFALAAATALGDTPAARHAAYLLLPDVARTATHLFTFLNYRRQFAGTSAGLRRAVGNWYLRRDPDQLAYQLVKYRQREGWTHRDLLRQAHPGAVDPRRRKYPARSRTSVPAEHRAVFDWACGRGVQADILPPVIAAFEQAQAGSKADWLRLITDAPAFSWEFLPDAALTDAEVWAAMLRAGRVPQTALIRQLPRLTRLGVFRDRELLGRVAGQLVDLDRLRRARVHPIHVLIALRTYAAGRSERGSSTWAPEPRIIDALDEAFYVAYGAVIPSGRRHLLALDVSGSMGMHQASGLPFSCLEASAALAMVTMATEPDTHAVGFTNALHPRHVEGTGLTPLGLSTRQRLDDAVRAVSSLPFGGTDCALPMLYAADQRLEIDTFVVYTDNETWAGKVHPHQALRAYRERSGIDARLVVVALTPTRLSIADPADPLQMDVAGMDKSLPGLLADFSAGRI